MLKWSFTWSSIIRFSIFCGSCLIILLPLSANAYDFHNCYTCHIADLTEDASRMYLHTPFALEQCGTCHAAEKPSASAIKAVDIPDRSKVNWLADTGVVEHSHSFLLPGDKVSDNLVVELWAPDGKISRHEIAVPLLNSLSEVADPGKVPAIFDVQVLKVERGVFLSATIGWRTDTLTSGLVRYGDEVLSKISEPNKRLGLRHEVTVHDLKPDRTYLFSVVSTDLFGRSETSEPLKFSTSNPYIAPAEESDNPLQKGTEEGVSSSFQRLGTDYLLELTLAQPAAVYVGSNGVARPQISTAENTGTSADEDTSHKTLNSQAMISMKACKTCHYNQSTITHPVNVYPKPGMTIPAEYPTLPDGRITCGSCHISHSSDYEYLARKRGKRELCVGCHKDML